jgi:hypothetical protein
MGSGSPAVILENGLGGSSASWGFVQPDIARFTRESAAGIRATRRKLDIPVTVVTAGRASDAAWRALQADQVGLSERGCLVVAERSGHVVAVDQPEVVVAAGGAYCAEVGAGEAAAAFTRKSRPL